MKKWLSLLICLISQLCLAGCDKLPISGNASEKWQDSMDQAIRARGDKHYYEAEQHYQDALAQAERLGEGDLRLARTQLEYAELLLLQGKNEQAEALCRKAYYTYESRWDRHDHSLNNRDIGLLLARAELHLADIDRARRNYEEGERLYKFALEAEEASVGPDSLKQSILSGYGKLLHETGEWEKASELVKNASQLSSIEQDAQSAQSGSRVWGDVEKAADEARDGGNYPVAEKLYLQAIALAEKNEPAPEDVENPYGKKEKRRRLPESLLALATAYDSQGSYSKAEPLLRRSLAEINANPLKDPGKDTKLKSEIVDRLASVYAHMGELAKAEEAYKQALKIALAENVQKHKHARKCMEGLTDVYVRESKLAEAEDIMVKMSKMTESEWGADSEKVGDDQIILAGIYEKRGKAELAKAAYEKALKVRSGRGGEDPRKNIKTLESYADFLKRQHDDARAEQIATQAKSLKSELLQEFK